MSGASSERQREALVERIEVRTAPIAAVLGIVFVLVVIGEGVAERGSTLQRVFVWTGWGLWIFFVAEFALRIALSPSRGRFLKRNWWQVLFLILPFLRFLQVLRLARLARAGRIVSSAVRGTRSAGAALGSRLATLLAVHVIVVLAVSEFAYEFVPLRPFGRALYAVALASVAGEPIRVDSGLAQGLTVLLAMYAVVVFAAIAGAAGAYFLESGREPPAPEPAPTGPSTREASGRLR